MMTIPYPGGQRAGPIAVEDEPVLGALLAPSADEGGDLQHDPLTQAAVGQLGDQLPCGAAIK
jgi:hypothetical protein